MLFSFLSSEVEDIVNMHPDLFDSVVYGVRVPGCEGRVGMCATRIQPGKTFNPESVYTLCEFSLTTINNKFEY